VKIILIAECVATHPSQAMSGQKLKAFVLIAGINILRLIGTGDWVSRKNRFCIHTVTTSQPQQLKEVFMSSDRFNDRAQAGILSILFEKGYYLNEHFFFYEGIFYASDAVREALMHGLGELFERYPPTPDELED
jgi:hypothetical protein